MISVGIRELKQQTSKLLRRVRENGEIIEITYHGESIARLVPVAQPETSDEDIAAVWADLDQLTAEISAKWPEGVSAVDAVKDVRREL
ncbi:MAG: type II toxin-antitoxin system prevent-host-death family antitoxin [Ardenticatenaceae bacterium]|nr:type II toxin-antitoxin system prevent-host-death family antitoxin [Ardenticatenaceae bacterium]MCB9442637.1 type II toxin-antitoxin system prevent-host-death family antitoxin [Ardenticatenaceae bacterium]